MPLVLNLSMLHVELAFRMGLMPLVLNLSRLHVDTC